MNRVLWTTSPIRICLVPTCQVQPHLRHFQECGSVLFIFRGVCNFQALCGEATILVRPAHAVPTRDLCGNAERSKQVPLLAGFYGASNFEGAIEPKAAI